MYLMISIHAPNTGSDSLLEQRLSFLKISIHAPNTGSDELNCDNCGCTMISIHAPNTGSDLDAIPSTTRSIKFQSTLPIQGATS